MFAQGKWLNCDKEQFHMSFHCCCAQAWQDNCPIIKQRGVSQRSRVHCEKTKTNQYYVEMIDCMRDHVSQVFSSELYV